MVFERERRESSYRCKFNIFSQQERPFLTNTVLSRFSSSKIFYDVQSNYEMIGSCFISPFRGPRWGGSPPKNQTHHGRSFRQPVYPSLGMDSPGPGAYSPQRLPLRTHHSGVIKVTSNRFSSNETIAPGPGSYFQEEKSGLSRRGVVISKGRGGEDRLLKTWRVGQVRRREVKI